jgi:DNA polymerase-3 subunit delta
VANVPRQTTSRASDASILRLVHVAPELKPAYLISGDDEVRLDDWRSRVRARAQSEAPAASFEVLRDDRLTAEAFAATAGALTLSVGRRYLLVEGVERWKEADVKQAVAALKSPVPETVIVLICADKAPAALAKAVERCGGEVHVCEAPRLAAYPRWVSERARELGIGISRDAALVLIEHIGRHQQRLMRELEKLATFAGEGVTIGVDEVEAISATAADSRAYELADALVDGDGARALRLAEELRARGEDIMHILFALLRQLRNAHRVSAMMAAGRSIKDIQSELRVPPFIARKLTEQARRADPERLEHALELLADLDYAFRGAGDLDADSALTLTITSATSAPAAA